MPVIELDHVRRVFKTSTGTLRRHKKEIVAVDDFSLEVAPGELFGLLGPNGAGKTTIIKILTTLLIPTSGSARVLGLDVVRDAKQVRQRIGFVFGGERGLYYRLSARDNLRYFAELYRLAPREIGPRVDELLMLVGLKGRAEERVEGFSRGMKQRLHLARTLLHRPSVLFLDEPTIGLDPIAARELRQTIADLHRDGATIILTTHYMFEADALCQRIGVIGNGRLLAEGTPNDLKHLVRERSVVELEVYGAGETELARLRQLDFVESVAVERRELRQILRVQTALGDRAVPGLMAALPDLEIGRVTTREATLEDAYVQLVGKVE